MFSVLISLKLKVPCTQTPTSNRNINPNLLSTCTTDGMPAADMLSSASIGCMWCGIYSRGKTHDQDGSLTWNVNVALAILTVFMTPNDICFLFHFKPSDAVFVLHHVTFIDKLCSSCKTASLVVVGESTVTREATQTWPGSEVWRPLGKPWEVNYEYYLKVKWRNGKGIILF